MHLVELQDVAQAAGWRRWRGWRWRRRAVVTRCRGGHLLEITRRRGGHLLEHHVRLKEDEVEDENVEDEEDEEEYMHLQHARGGVPQSRIQHFSPL